jgi:hypothetical protein
MLKWFVEFIVPRDDGCCIITRNECDDEADAHQVASETRQTVFVYDVLRKRYTNDLGETVFVCVCAYHISERIKPGITIVKGEVE